MVSLIQQPTQQDSDEELEYAENSSGTVEIPCKFQDFNSYLCHSYLAVSVGYGEVPDACMFNLFLSIPLYLEDPRRVVSPYWTSVFQEK